MMYVVHFGLITCNALSTVSSSSQLDLTTIILVHSRSFHRLRLLELSVFTNPNYLEPGVFLVTA